VTRPEDDNRPGRRLSSVVKPASPEVMACAHPGAQDGRIESTREI
jgi:hypothetical protein